MDTNLIEFMRLIRENGLVRSNRFDVGFFLPASLKDIVKRLDDESRFDEINGGRINQAKAMTGGVALSRHLSVVAKSINDPGVTFNTNDTNTGYKRKVAYDKQQADLEIVFICTGNMFEKRMFTEWAKLMLDDRHRLAYYDDYVTDLTLSAEKQDGNASPYNINIKEAFPIAIGQLQWDRSENNSFMILPVTFTYRKIDREDRPTNTPSRASTADSSFIPFGVEDSTSLSVPEAPALSQNASGNDLYRSINTVSEEVSNGMDAEDGAKVVGRYVHGVQESTSISEEDKEKITTYGAQIISALLNARRGKS